MNEELTNGGLAESHSPETDKLALSITEMINAASAERKEPAAEKKELPLLPPELERLLNEEISFSEESVTAETEEAPVADEVYEDEEPAAEEESVEEAPLSEAEPAEEAAAEDEITEETAEEPVEETAEDASAEEEIKEESAEEESAAEEITEEPVEEPAAEEITEEPVEEPVAEEITEEPATEEIAAEPAEAAGSSEESPAEPSGEAEETDAQPEAFVPSEDITATDPDVLFIKEPPADGGRYLLTPDTDGDAFRGSIAEICDNIRVFLPDKQGCKIIAVTSAGRGEGKSSAALLLAMALASDKRVLLADCDFISPQLHKYFNCVNKKGVLNAADGECRLGDVALNTDIKGLKFVTAGLLPEGREVDPVSVSACLTAEADFDFIVCDLPSVNKCKYAAALAGAADGAVVVARIGVTGYPALTRALKNLRKADAYLLGAVLNGR